jgi:hypothetical protein
LFAALIHHNTSTAITPVSLESGLGLLAKFATSALTSTSLSSSLTSPFYGTGAVVKRNVDDKRDGVGLGDLSHAFGIGPGGSPKNKRRGKLLGGDKRVDGVVSG